MITIREKQELKQQLVASLQEEKNIRKVVVFGSFLYSDNPQDMDVAVFQDSSEGYVKFAMKYRKMTRAVSKKLPIDIFPIRPNADNALILDEIANGEIVYEK
jgi:predicted nucleotidyltransferase